MKNIFLILTLMLSQTAIGEGRQNDDTITTEPINSSMTKVEEKVRNASVKVMINGGHGSGSLIKYKGSQFIITANHVIDVKRAYFGMPVHVIGINQTKVASLVYFDSTADIAVLFLPKTEYFRYTQPIKWNPTKDIPEVGTYITYSGYPSWHSLLTFRGRVAGYETSPNSGVHIILNVFGWFGSSGSVVYTDKGEIVGVLWAVDVERFPTKQVNENIVWVSPIKNLNMEIPMKIICDNYIKKIKNCEQRKQK